MINLNTFINNLQYITNKYGIKTNGNYFTQHQEYKTDVIIKEKLHDRLQKIIIKIKNYDEDIKIMECLEFLYVDRYERELYFQLINNVELIKKYNMIRETVDRNLDAYNKKGLEYHMFYKCLKAYINITNTKPSDFYDTFNTLNINKVDLKTIIFYAEEIKKEIWENFDWDNIFGGEILEIVDKEKINKINLPSNLFPNFIRSLEKNFKNVYDCFNSLLNLEKDYLNLSEEQKEEYKEQYNKLNMLIMPLIWQSDIELLLKGQEDTYLEIFNVLKKYKEQRNLLNSFYSELTYNYKNKTTYKNFLHNLIEDVEDNKKLDILFSKIDYKKVHAIIEEIQEKNNNKNIEIILNDKKVFEFKREKEKIKEEIEKKKNMVIIKINGQEINLTVDKKTKVTIEIEGNNINIIKNTEKKENNEEECPTSSPSPVPNNKPIEEFKKVNNNTNELKKPNTEPNKANKINFNNNLIQNDFDVLETNFIKDIRAKYGIKASEAGCLLLNSLNGNNLRKPIVLNLWIQQKHDFVNYKPITLTAFDKAIGTDKRIENLVKICTSSIKQ